MVIVLWFVHVCTAGNRPLKKRPTCSHAEMQSPCEHVGRSLQWNQYDSMDLHRRGHSGEGMVLPFSATMEVLGGGSSDDVRWGLDHEMGGSRWEYVGLLLGLVLTTWNLFFW